MKFFTFIVAAVILSAQNCGKQQVVEKRMAVIDGRSAEWTRNSKGELFWNDAAKKLSEEWKREYDLKRDRLRMVMVANFAEDSSLIKGLTQKEIEAFLGKPEIEGNSYKYDFHYEDGKYLGCWMFMEYDEAGKVKDVVRACP